ncbi:AMP-binding protein [Nonomuraea gerenzanensis]|uniref:Long-chain fatty-acid-CoA ligase, Mycobacterial subgroup FadD1 n=1 Tax=Nonomuraea gerenzanensis TaxID=93944 RepID=A0A1M4EP14_9ACTN|nr:AMP-binding protein [Nonomuraea gerenzanensis]UBU12054.1 AMP-binding protein [Nonomuraea gerenzanensis]SBP00570.1 Long-chain fatty-acid-CoA ligase, Mycobacterial subgroup FadD1 [Nonomuraea gerenzanensis]
MTADTLASLLLARAEDDRPGVVFEGGVCSWREHVAACLAAGARLSALGAGTHAGVLSENVPELVSLIGGAALAGHVVVALNPTRSVDELIRDARATDVDVVLADAPYGGIAQALSEALGVPALPLAPEEHAPAAAASVATVRQVEPAPGDLVMLIFTSGTSGRPRAVRITQRKLAVPGVSLAALLTPEDAVYCSMPLFHSGALMASYAPAVASGAALVLRRRFSASGLLPDIRRYGCTYLHYVGKALSYALATPEQPDDADNPLRIAFGNEGSAVAVRRFGERFGCVVIDAFGSTETAISLTPDPAGPPGCLGRLPEGVRILDPFTGRPCPTARIEDGRLLNPDEAIGELVNTAGLGLFEGYYNDPDADAERIRDGAFWSGDLAYADAGGYVFFAGRGTERLRVDGENLAVAPIEAALREFGGVVEAAVYPVPDPAAGDQVMAALVLEGAFDPGAFTAFLAARRDLGVKAVPRFVRVCRELPQTASHKVIKRHLARDGWRTADPVWVRGPDGLRLLTEADAKGIEEEFVRHGRQHLLET